MEEKHWLQKFEAVKNSTRKISIIIKTTTIQPLNPLDSDIVYVANGEILSSLSLVVLIICYGIVVFSGVCGNSTLLVSLCSSRLKNPLLLALCFADLLVSIISAPITIVTLILKQNQTLPWSMRNSGCYAFHYMQSMPVACSCLCLLMLSLDRFATVKHPRLAQLHQRHFLPSILASLSWIGAIIICLPILLVYKVTSASNIPSSSVLNLTSSRNTNSINEDKHCVAVYGSEEWHILLSSTYNLTIFVIPFFGVIINHIGVRRKLCALSLTARAQHGELPLPMPAITILKRPSNMNLIIVTGIHGNIPNNEQDCLPCTSSNCSNNNRRHNNNRNGFNQIRLNNNLETSEEQQNLMTETQFRASPRTPRSMRRTQQQLANARAPAQPPAHLPIPQTSTLRSRRRLANILVAASVIFIACWLPHVYCKLCREFSNTCFCTYVVNEFLLVLGFAHSAVSPVIHWMLNYNSIRQSNSQPFSKFSSAHKFLRSHLRFQGAPVVPPASSTNENALGPFNPRLIKSRPQAYRPPASSHFLY
ncbi:unnamed protein product [Diamesa tonsa]